VPSRIDRRQPQAISTSRQCGGVATVAMTLQWHSDAGFLHSRRPMSVAGTTRKRLAARIYSANWGEADSNAAARNSCG
jgi:hypothetical protein